MSRFKGKNLKYVLLLIGILLIAFVLRVYKISSNPPSVFWDEASVGYNAYTISHWGKDEWGKILPLAFRSFGEYKLPVHIYLTAPFVLLFNLSAFSVRIPAALFGVASVYLIYLVGRKMFKSELVGLAAAFVLAVSPYNLQFSRFNHELNFAIFFFLLGLYLFYEGLEKRKKLIPLSYLSFGISLISYNAAKIIVPFMVLLLTVLYFKKLLKQQRYFVMGILIFIGFGLLMVIEPNLLGLERLQQTSISVEEIENTNLYNQTNSLLLGRIELTGREYMQHLEKEFLFETGDKNPRHSIQSIGVFYRVEGLFLIFGFISLLYAMLVKRSKEAVVLICWVLIAIIPSAIVAPGESPHSGRAMFMTASWHLMIAYGLYTAYKLVKFKPLQYLLIASFVFFVFIDFTKYIKDYYREYPQKYAIEWQYGMKDIGDHMRRMSFKRAFITNVRHHPYIFMLFHLRTPLPEFLETVEYEEEDVRGYSLVRKYNNLQFGGWDSVESYPASTRIYVLTPSEFSGLRYKNDFIVEKLVKYPDESDAFYIVRGP